MIYILSYLIISSILFLVWWKNLIKTIDGIAILSTIFFGWTFIPLMIIFFCIEQFRKNSICPKCESEDIIEHGGNMKRCVDCDTYWSDKVVQ